MMRKLSILGLALLSLGIAVSAMADPTAYVNINVTVTEAIGASIVRDTVADNQNITMALNTTGNLTGTTVFRNNGSIAANWSIIADTTHLADGTTPWTLKGDATALAPNQIRVKAIFYYDSAGNPTIANFSDDDILSTTRTNCSATVFADAAGAADQKGINVPTLLSGNPLRNIWFAIDAPITGSYIGAVKQLAAVVWATIL